MSFHDSFTFLILAVIVFLLITTFLIKKFIKTARTYYVLSMIRTVRFNSLLDRLSFIGRPLDYLAYAGTILGFGIIGADFLFKQYSSKKSHRIIFGIFSFTGLWLLFDFFFKPIFASNPGTHAIAFMFPFVFSIFGLAGFMIFSLAANAVDIVGKILLGKKACPGIAPLIPGVEIPNVPVVVPFIAWIPLFLILIIHEFSHGVQARKEKVRIKSTGLLLAGLFPIGAFVEPDEHQLKRKSKIKQLRIMANGPSSNLVSIFIALLIAFLLTPLIAPIQSSVLETRAQSVDFIQITKVESQLEFCGDTYPSPSLDVLEPGMKIWTVNSQKVHSSADVFREISLARADKISVTLGLEKDGNFFERTMSPSLLGLFGFSMEEVKFENFDYPPNYEFNLAILTAYGTILNWFIILSLLIALVNFLPVDPFDGGKMARIIYPDYLSFLQMPPKQTVQFMQRGIIFIVLILFVLNALPLFL